MLTDAAVAEYIGCTAEQVRIMRLRKWRCAGCEAVHVSFPSIKAFHSPCCGEGRKCASCGVLMPHLLHGHELGLICETCYES
jgi:hypothetical protein